MDESFTKRIKQHNQLFDSHWLNFIQTAVRLEFILAAALEAKFTNDIRAQKVVGGLAGLIKLSYALGVISQNTYESLLKFKKIRDRLAHESEPWVRLSEAKGYLKFLGANVNETLEPMGTCLTEWHIASLDLLVDHVQKEATNA